MKKSFFIQLVFFNCLFSQDAPQKGLATTVRAKPLPVCHVMPEGTLLQFSPDGKLIGVDEIISMSCEPEVSIPPLQGLGAGVASELPAVAPCAEIEPALEITCEEPQEEATEIEEATVPAQEEVKEALPEPAEISFPDPALRGETAVEVVCPDKQEPIAAMEIAHDAVVCAPRAEAATETEKQETKAAPVTPESLKTEAKAIEAKSKKSKKKMVPQVYVFEKEVHKEIHKEVHTEVHIPAPVQPQQQSPITALEERLLSYAMQGRSSNIKQILKNPRVNVNITDRDGRTPLMLAILFGHSSAVKVILQSNPDLTLQSKLDETALSIAQAQGHRKFVDLLLKAGAEEPVAR